MFAITKDNFSLVVSRGEEIVSKVDSDSLPLSIMGTEISYGIAKHFGSTYAAALTHLHPALCPPIFVQWENASELRIKYYDCERALERDKPVSTTLGRWLTNMRLFGNIDSIIDNVRSSLVKGDVKFAVTARDIELVYQYGPSSCMSDYKGFYRLNRTTRNEKAISVPSLYAYPYDRTEIVPESGNNLAVAYMGNIEDINRQRVISRAVCDMKAMTFNRIYGDIPRMFRSLIDLGFKQNKDLLLGVPLTKVIDSDRDLVLCPYLDAKATSLVRIEDDRIYLSLRGTHKFNTEKYLIWETDNEGDSENANDDDE